VADVHRDARAVPDLDGLVDGSEQVRPLAADVRGVDPTGPRGFLGERDDLRGVGVHPRRVDQPRRQAHGAGVHRFGHRPPHRLELVRARRTTRLLHRQLPHRTVSDQGRDVHGGAGIGDPLEERAEGVEREVLDRCSMIAADPRRELGSRRSRER
jgi:hypothetical protein